MSLSTQRVPCSSSSSSSSSSSTIPSTYDVFLSFRGKDTRNGFTDHLHDALKQRGITVFRDDKKLQQGKDISEELSTAIKESQYAVVIISKNFAISKWCLRELTQIVECMREGRLKVLPVFYQVDPSDVRKQKGTFAKAFDKHREYFKINGRQTKSHRTEMNEVADCTVDPSDVRRQKRSFEEASNNHGDNPEINRRQMKSRRTDSKESVEYAVDPSVARNQEMHFVESSAPNADNRDPDQEPIKSWRDALEEVGNLCGWHVNNSSEATVVKQIATKIVRELRLNSSEMFKNLVGVESKVEELLSLLCLENDDVRYIGIHGMGGVGKTTLVRVLYDRICDKFDASCFICGTKDNKSCSIAELREQIIHEILKEYNKRIWNDYCGIGLLEMKLRNKKNLIVFDDINQEQLEALAGSPKWFGRKSRIVLTSRDCQFWKPLVSDDNIYELKPLDQEDALQLFCWKVFNRPKPREDFVELSENIARYARGLPLAIKVIGSSLVGKEMVVWNSFCDNLEANPHAQILDKLQLSYDWLDDLPKRLFLDIACLFNGKYVEHIIPIWRSQGLYPESSIDVLRDKSLLEFSWDGHLHMHDLIQKMGQRIVFRENLEEPGKRSRLCHSNDIDHVLRNKSGTNVVEGIVWDLPLEKREQLSLEGFSKLTRLKILVIRKNNFQDSFDTLTWFKDRSKFMLSKELRVLKWDGYPLSSLRRSFQGENLIELRINYSSIKQLWVGRKNFNKLKRIDLCFSDLTEMPNLSGTPNVEDINLGYCTKLRKVHHSIGYLKQLRYLNLYGCKKLEKFPDKISLESLEELNLAHCSKLKKFPEIVGNMTSLRQLYLSGTAIKTLPFSFQRLSSLSLLSLSGWGRTNAIRLPKDGLRCSCGFFLCSDSNPSSFWFLKWLASLSSLSYLGLNYCGLSEETFSSNFSLPSLNTLYLSGNAFTIIPKFLGQLSSLKRIFLSSCNLSDDVFSNYLGFLPCVDTLDLGKNPFTTLPDSFCLHSSLGLLYLDCCKQLKALPKLPLNLKVLSVCDCPLLEMIYHQTDNETSWREFCACVWLSAATINGYDGTPYKTIQLHPRYTIPLTKGFYDISNVVTWGPTLRSKIPEWFNERSNSLFRAIQSRVDVNLEAGWKGYALFVVYEVHVHGFPEFVFQFQVDDIGRKHPLVLCAPEACSVGVNGFWVYIPRRFCESVTDLNYCGYLGVSVATNSLNVELKECGARLIKECDVSEFFDILNDISPRGLELTKLEDFNFEMVVGNDQDSTECLWQMLGF